MLQTPPTFTELPHTQSVPQLKHGAPRPTQVRQVAAPEPEPKRTVLYLATPCYACCMTVQYLTSVLALQGACIQRGVELTIDFIGNESLVQRARNVLVARFMQSQATHLLFIDADIGFDAQTVFRLLEQDKDVTTAIYPKKMIDWNMVDSKIKSGTKENLEQAGVDFNINIIGNSVAAVNGFVPVLDAATGFMLVTRSLLQRMTDHFRAELDCVNDITGTSATVPTYVALFDCMIDPDTRRYLSEDYAFCRRVQQMGGEIWADIASPLVHMGTQVYTGDMRHRFVISYAS